VVWSPAGMMRVVLALAVCSAVVALSPSARASFTVEQAAELARGQPLVEPLAYDRGDQHFVGGVSYLIVERDAALLSSIARDVTRFWELMPNVRFAKLLSISPSGTATVRVEHEVGPTSGGYTLKISFSEEGRLGRFFLDHGADNSIDDAWGFVRLTPVDGGARTLVTWAVLFDLGPGVLRTLFESRIQKAALSYPSRLANAAAH
jgi:hypothetical protein